jgi:hypothetical protein
MTRALTSFPQLEPDQRTELIVDSGVQKLSGVSASPVLLQGRFKRHEVYLGEAHTDAVGRLVVLAGRGLSRSIADPENPYPLILTDFDSPDWIDDTSDGWIDVKAEIGGKR